MGDMIFPKPKANPAAALAAQQAQQAAAREAARQARLNQGTEQINTLFDQFGQPFYDQYRTAYEGIYQPEMDRQYQDAREQLTFDLSRSGLLRSTVGAEGLADLERQNEYQQGQFRSRADEAVTGLQTQVGNQKQAALDQLYATENPDLAYNTALTSQQQLLQSKPSLGDIGALFDIPAIGASQYFRGTADRHFADAAGLGATDPYRSAGRVIT